MDDEVDRLVAAWRRERPDLDVEPLEVLSRVSRLARHLDRARRIAFSEHQLESWEFDVLTSLRRAGTPYQLSPGQLLTQTLVTSGTMTNRIDRLTGWRRRAWSSGCPTPVTGAGCWSGSPRRVATAPTRRWPGCWITSAPSSPSCPRPSARNWRRC
jgi:hypothetical protein